MSLTLGTAVSDAAHLKIVILFAERAVVQSLTKNVHNSDRIFDGFA